MATKTCSICGEEKPLDDFPVNKTGRLGRQGRCTPCDNEYTKTWRATNREQFNASVRQSQLKRLYSITTAEYEELLSTQNGVCAICGGEDPSGRRLAVDHDHGTNVVRGLLCRPCNAALGLLKEDAGILLRATQYLSRSLN